MQRRAFVRTTLAGALLAPGSLALPRRGFAAPAGLHTATRQANPIRLASNENPLGVPESARRAIIEGIGEGHRYPRLNATVAARIAAVNRVATENVVLGNGSAEILQMTVQAIAAADRGVRVVIADPTFEQVERYARAMGAEVVKVPLLPDQSHDIDRMHAAAASAPGRALVFVCNPNNPPGTLTSCDAVAQWLRAAPESMWFLIDEAYLEFVDHPGYRAFVAEATARPNTLVSRTFSKIYALAGIRLGYGIAHPETIRRVDAFAAGTNINHLALAAGLACLDDAAFVKKSLDVNASGLRFAERTLRDLGIEYLPSHANFIMHRIRGDHTAYVNRMRDDGINVGRAFPPMTAWNRVSIGLPSEMEAWAAALKKARAAGLV